MAKSLEQRRASAVDSLRDAQRELACLAQVEPLGMDRAQASVALTVVEFALVLAQDLAVGQVSVESPVELAERVVGPS